MSGTVRSPDDVQRKSKVAKVQAVDIILYKQTIMPWIRGPQYGEKLFTVFAHTNSSPTHPNKAISSSTTLGMNWTWSSVQVEELRLAGNRGFEFMRANIKRERGKNIFMCYDHLYSFLLGVNDITIMVKIMIVIKNTKIQKCEKFISISTRTNSFSNSNTYH